MAKVAIITDVLGSDGAVFGGGAERQTFQLARLAIAAGADVTVYQGSKQAGVGLIEGVRVRSLAVTNGSIWSSATRQAIADGNERFHYKYLAHVPRAARSLRASATHFAIYWDIPFEKKLSNWYPLGSVARFYLPTWRRWNKRRCMAALRRCREVLADNTSLIRLVQSDSPNLRDRIFYAPNFSDLKPDRGNPRAADCAVPEIDQAKREGRLIILVPRNLTLKQGIASLPELVEALHNSGGHDCQFIVTGRFINALPQTAHYKEQLEIALRSMSPRARHRLTFLHGVKHEFMPYCYAAADIVVLPSFASEGTPLAAIEAMTFGKPIVATNIGGLNDVIDDGVNGMLVRPSTDDLAAAIRLLVRDHDLCARLGAAARSKAERQFSLAAWESRVLPFMDRNGWFAENGSLTKKKYH